MAVSTDLETVAGWIRDARLIVVLTGAGISTESGIPDFRGPQGVWTKNPEAEKTATLQYYLSDPEIRKRAWENRLRSEMWRAEPNTGHRALAELERKAALHTLVTQNVDGLHQKAGNEPRAGHRDPRQRPRGEVHVLHVARAHARDTRTGPGGRRRPALPRL